MKTVELPIKTKVRAIIQFGPPTVTSGFRAGEYYEVILDPNMLSPNGDYIRFDQTFQKTEMHGWQRVKSLTVCEILGEEGDYEKTPPGYAVDENAVLRINALDGK